jgi:SAM-dependent methyltransferase
MSAESSSTNYWRETACARAFWGQQELPPYRRLLADTATWLDPQPGERWLDLGCGSGQLARVLWTRSGGQVAEVIGLDLAAVNEQALRKLRASLQPAATEDRLHFVASDFNTGLAAWEAGRFDGVVSGLAIQYAESYSPEKACWTSAAYDGVLAHVLRVLRPGGQFVFSVNVPEPSWLTVAVTALPGVFGAPRPLQYVKRALRMLSYGGWLKREARRGRFHFLPLETILRKLSTLGFVAAEHKLSFAGQAYVIRCRKPARAQAA